MEKDPDKTLELTSGEYLRELGRRVRGYSRRNVIGGRATREVDYAGMLLEKIGEEWVERKNDAT